MFNYKYKRLCAFIFDAFFIMLLTLLISNSSFCNPGINYETYYTEEYNKVVSNIDVSNYNEENIQELYSSLEEPIYNLVRSRNYSSMWFLIFTFLYYVVFVYSTKGYTLGKKIFKLKVVNKDKKRVGILNLIPRTIFMGTTLIYQVPIIVLLQVIGTLILTPHMFLYYLVGLSILSFIIELIMFISFIKAKDNIMIDDKICSTRVIETK